MKASNLVLAWECRFSSGTANTASGSLPGRGQPSANRTPALQKLEWHLAIRIFSPEGFILVLVRARHAYYRGSSFFGTHLTTGPGWSRRAHGDCGWMPPSPDWRHQCPRAVSYSWYSDSRTGSWSQQRDGHVYKFIYYTMGDAYVSLSHLGHVLAALSLAWTKEEESERNGCLLPPQPFSRSLQFPLALPSLIFPFSQPDQQCHWFTTLIVIYCSLL